MDVILMRNSFCFKLGSLFYKISKYARTEYKVLKFMFENISFNAMEIVPFSSDDVKLVENSKKIIKILNNPKLRKFKSNVAEIFAHWMTEKKFSFDEMEMITFPYLTFTKFPDVEFNKKKFYALLHFIKKFQQFQDELRKLNLCYVDPHEMNIIHHKARFYLIDFDFVIPIDRKLGFCHSIYKHAYFGGNSTYSPPIICNGIKFLENIPIIKKQYLDVFHILLADIPLRFIENEEDAENIYLRFSSSHLLLYVITNSVLQIYDREDHMDIYLKMRDFRQKHLNFIQGEGKNNEYPDIFDYFTLNTHSPSSSSSSSLSSSSSTQLYSKEEECTMSEITVLRDAITY